MAILGGVAVYFFLFNTAGLKPMPVPAEGAVTDPLLAAKIQSQLTAIDEKPASLDRRLSLCMLYHGNDLHPTAQQCYEMITEVAPEHPRAWFHLAHVLDQQGDSVGAMEAMRTAVARSDGQPYPHWQLGMMLVTSERPLEALPYLEKAREKLGDDPLVITSIARALIESGSPEAGLELLQLPALTTNPQVGPYVQYLRAEAFDALDQPEAAETARALAAPTPPLTIDPWMISIINARADLPTLRQQIGRAVRAQEWATARELLELLRQYEVFTDETRMLEATILARTGAPEKAREMLNQMVEADPTNDSLALNLANVELEIATTRQDPALAEAALATADRILEEDPTNLAAHGICMRAFETLNRPTEAIASCRAAWRIDGNNPMPLQLAAVLINRHELWKDNEDLLRELWTRAPGHVAAGPLLVLSLADQGRNAEARQILRQLTQASLDADLLSRARTAAEAAP